MWEEIDSRNTVRIDQVDGESLLYYDIYFTYYWYGYYKKTKAIKFDYNSYKYYRINVGKINKN